MKKVGGRRNFGWGRKAEYAGIMALNRYFHKKPSSRYSHKYRWKVFCRFLFKAGIIDVRKVSLETLEDFASLLRNRILCGEIKISYAVNILSSVNVVISLLREDKVLRISPAEYLGKRTRIRTISPKGIDKQIVYTAIDEIYKQGAASQAMALRVMREFGCRKREGASFNAIEALEQAKRLGKIRIIYGSKGGYCRTMQRWITVSPEQIVFLAWAAEVQGDRENLRPASMSLATFMESINHYWSTVRTKYNLGKIHDLRAAYACERYQKITASPAPVLVDGKIMASIEKDQIMH